MKRFFLFFVILIGICIIYSIGLGSSPLLDPDEPIYGQFIKEMANSGDYLTPHYDNKPWFDKPPMFYWLSAVCVKIGGLNEFTVRFPSALFGALTVLMVFFLTCHDFGRKAGAIAVAVAGTTLMQIILVHAAATDSVMVFFMVAGLYFYRRWLDSSGRQATAWMAACGAAAGFGLVTKGPSVPLLLLMAFFAHLIWIKQLKRLKSVDSIIAIVIALIIGMPWYIAMYKMHGQLFIDQFIIANNVTRFTKAMHKSQLTNWFSYLKTIGCFIIFFFPWNVFMFKAIISKWRINDGAKLAICWIGAVLLLFSTSKTQNFTYSFPAFPICAVLVGAYLAGLADEQKGRKTALVGLLAGFIISVLVAVALFIIAKDKYPALMGQAGAAGAILVLAYGVPLVFVKFFKLLQDKAYWIVAAGMIAFNFMVVCVIAPSAGNLEGSKKLVERIKASNPAQVALYNSSNRDNKFFDWKPGIFYYLNTKPLDSKTPAELKLLADNPKPALIISKKKFSKDFEQDSFVKLFNEGGLDVYANKAYIKSVPYSKSGPNIP